MKFKGILNLAVAGVISLLAACGGGETASTDNPVAPAAETIAINGAGIKGPLAFADTQVFAYDPAFPDLYDKNAPIATAMTDQYAQISGLAVPRKIKPPYILTIGGAQAIDLNTGKAPVISTLITVVTSDMLSGNDPIYATPLTTLAFDMARHAGTQQTDAATFESNVLNAAAAVGGYFAIDPNHSIDIFRSPVVLNKDTKTAVDQEEAVFHRAAIEGFAAKIYQLSKMKGDGLYATYYNSMDLTSKAVNRVDPGVDFNWGLDAPATGVTKERFSVRWTGLIKADYSENYTFYTSTDDGVRLWINNQLIVDQWTDHPVKTYSGSIQLQAGKTYPITMEYYDHTQHAVARLLWSSASQPKAVVPKDNLYSVPTADRLSNLTTDALIDRLALDIQSDGVINNIAGEEVIGGVDTEIVKQDPLPLVIPNTTYRVSGTVALMEEERVQTGSDASADILVDSQILNQTTTSDPVSGDSTSGGSTSGGSTSGGSTSGGSTSGGSTSGGSTSGGSTSGGSITTPVIGLSTDSIDFGNVNVGEISSPVAVKVSNSGTGDFTITAVKLSQGYLQTNNCNGFIPSSSSCTFTLKFVPISAGLLSGSLVIEGNSSQSAHLVSLTGNSTDPLPIDPPVVNPGDTIDPSAPEIKFAHDFNDEPLHTYTSTDILTTWKSGTAVSLQPNAVKIVKDPDPSGSRGKVMRVFYAANETTTDGNSGSQWRTKLGGTYDELYLAYYVYFTSDAEFMLGGKLPGLMGGPVIYAGGKPANGTDGWTGRLMWHKNGSVQSYMYVANNPSQYGWNFDWDLGAEGQRYLKRGQWNRLEMRYVMNTPGKLDGRLQTWFNGKLAVDTNAVMYRTQGGENVGIDQLLFSTFYGGKSSSWAPPTDQYIYFDNFVVSTKPITH